MNNTKIIEALNTIVNPYTDELVDFTKIETNIRHEGKTLILSYVPLGTDEAKNREFSRSIVRKLKIDLQIQSVRIVQIAPEKSEDELFFNTKVVAIMSGKGGVGKSQVTVNLAKSLTNSGKKVGIIDADIYGYSIPKILDLYGEPEVVDSKIIPLSKLGIEVISTQYFIGENQNEAIAWRAPMLNKMMRHLFNDVLWNPELDYMLIDLPPGTGDVFLNLTQYVEDVYSLLITTANKDAAHVALRAGKLANDLNFKTLGIIENMSYYEHQGEKLAIFGTEGANIVANELGYPVIARLPITDDESQLTEKLQPVLKVLEEEK